jgi:hypothetical protein
MSAENIIRITKYLFGMREIRAFSPLKGNTFLSIFIQHHFSRFSVGYPESETFAGGKRGLRRIKTRQSNNRSYSAINRSHSIQYFYQLFFGPRMTHHSRFYFCVNVLLRVF